MSQESRVTSREVALRANVSQMTVSLVFSGKDSRRVSEATRNRVLAAAQEIGYRPHPNAIALRTGRTRTIGLMIARLKNPFFAQLADDAERYLRDAGYQALLNTASVSEHVSLTHYASRNGWLVDGALLWATAEQSLGMYLGIEGLSLPVVYMGHERRDAADVVACDFYGGARQALAHLYVRGRRHIGFVTPYALEPERDEARGRAYRDFCREAGMEARLLPAPDAQHTLGGSLQCGLTLLQSGALAELDAVFCLNDLIALGLYHALRRHSRRIPDDLALCGYDGIDNGLYQDIPLTTVCTSTHELCAQGLEILQRRIEGSREEPQQRLLPAHLRIGGTT